MWNLREFLGKVIGLSDEEQDSAYERLKSYDRADRKRMFFQLTDADLKESYHLDDLAVRRAILTAFPLGEIIFVRSSAL